MYNSLSQNFKHVPNRNGTVAVGFKNSTTVLLLPYFNRISHYPYGLSFCDLQFILAKVLPLIKMPASAFNISMSENFNFRHFL